MKILVINETSDLGGAETMALELVNALSLIPGNQAGFVAARGVLTERLLKDVRYFPVSRYKPSLVLKIFSEFRGIFKEVQPDIIHLQGATIGIIASVAAKFFSPRTKVVITHHSVDFTRVPAWLANVLFKTCAHAFIAISKAKQASFFRDGYTRDRVFLIPNFVNRKHLQSTASDAAVDALRQKLAVMPEERVVVSAGRIVFEKRFDLFVTTLAECARQDRNVRIRGIVLGDGTERAKVQAMAEALNLDNLRIDFMGFQHNVAVYLRMADVFFFPTEWKEVLPMCLIEAIALGAPVVCSDIPGNHDIVHHGVNGFLVNVKDKAYAEPLLRLLKDEALRKQFSSNGIEKAAREYDKDKVVADIFNVYKKLMAGA